MLNKIFLGIIHQMSDAVSRVIGVVDDSSVVIACNDPSRIGESIHAVDFAAFAESEILIAGDCTYKAVGNRINSEFAVFVKGTDNEAKNFAKIVAIALFNAKQYYDEKHDKASFIKNVLLDNILPGDIYLRSRELKLSSDVKRICMVVKSTSKSDALMYEIVRDLFPEKSKDFVISLNESTVALVKEVAHDVDTVTFEKLAASISDTLTGEHHIHNIIGVGTMVNSVKELAKSFKEAKIAIEISKIFGDIKPVMIYDRLGISRLIYQLPTTMCEAFLNEIFKSGSVEDLDKETLFTIQKFFENSLNVSETSRKLFVHRNTLVYRLEKIKKITGLDLREFEDAIVFKVAMIVHKYLQVNPIKY